MFAVSATVFGSGAFSYGKDSIVFHRETFVVCTRVLLSQRLLCELVTRFGTDLRDGNKNERLASVLNVFRLFVNVVLALF